MDVRIAGITTAIMKAALERPGAAGSTSSAVQETSARRATCTPVAPRWSPSGSRSDKIRDVVGPDDKTIRGIVDRCSMKIDVEDDGRMNVESVNEE